MITPVDGTAAAAAFIAGTLSSSSSRPVKMMLDGMLKRCNVLSLCAWKHSNSNAWLHDLPQHAIRCVIVASQRSSAAASTSGTAGEKPTRKADYNKRQRLDDYCLQQFPQYSKNLVQSWIVQGKVLVNDKVRSL